MNLPNCPACLLRFKTRMNFILFIERSTNSRMLFGFVTFLFGWFFFLSDTVHSGLSEYALMMKLAPDWIWAIGYWINGIALMHGAYTNRYSKLKLMLEGTLGVVVWVGSAYAVTVTQGSIGAHAGGALIAFWIYVRYPTHWEGSR